MPLGRRTYVFLLTRSQRRRCSRAWQRALAPAAVGSLVAHALGCLDEGPHLAGILGQPCSRGGGGGEGQRQLEDGTGNGWRARRGRMRVTPTPTLSPGRHQALVCPPHHPNPNPSHKAFRPPGPGPPGPRRPGPHPHGPVGPPPPHAFGHLTHASRACLACNMAHSHASSGPWPLAACHAHTAERATGASGASRATCFGMRRSAAAAAGQPPVRTRASASARAPSGPQTPLDTSTADGLARLAACATFSGVSPPASSHPRRASPAGTDRLRQSRAWPEPPCKGGAAVISHQYCTSIRLVRRTTATATTTAASLQGQVGRDRRTGPAWPAAACPPPSAEKPLAPRLQTPPPPNRVELLALPSAPPPPPGPTQHPRPLPTAPPPLPPTHRRTLPSTARTRTRTLTVTCMPSMSSQSGAAQPAAPSCCMSAAGTCVWGVPSGRQLRT